MEKVTIEINSPTIDQLQKIHAILNGQEKVTKSNDSLAPLTGAAKSKKAGAKKAPAKTVSKDEDEDFGDEELDEEDLEDDSEDDADAEEDEDAGLSFDDVRDAINTYGEKNPAGMKTILTSFNVKNSKELKALPKKWEAVYRKVQAKLKVSKK